MTTIKAAIARHHGEAGHRMLSPQFLEGFQAGCTAGGTVQPLRMPKPAGAFDTAAGNVTPLERKRFEELWTKLRARQLAQDEAAEFSRILRKAAAARQRLALDSSPEPQPTVSSGSLQEEEPEASGRALDAEHEFLKGKLSATDLAEYLKLAGAKKDGEKKGEDRGRAHDDPPPFEGRPEPSRTVTAHEAALLDRRPVRRFTHDGRERIPARDHDIAGLDALRRIRIMPGHPEPERQREIERTAAGDLATDGMVDFLDGVLARIGAA